MNGQIKTVEDLRDTLAEGIQRLRQGKMTAHDLAAMTNATGKMIQSAKLELDYAKANGIKPTSAFVK